MIIHFLCALPEDKHVCLLPFAAEQEIDYTALSGYPLARLKTLFEDQFTGMLAQLNSLWCMPWKTSGRPEQWLPDALHRISPGLWQQGYPVLLDCRLLLTAGPGKLPVCDLSELLIAALLINYRPGRFKTSQQDEKIIPMLAFLVPENSMAETASALKRAQAIAEALEMALDMVNAPANKKTPEMLGKLVVQRARSGGYRAEVLLKADLEELGMGALLGVNQGSSEPAHLLVLEYKPANPRAKIGLVGKGVTFDTGGITLKKGENLHLLKSDMAGAAAVIAALDAAAHLKLPVHLIAVVPATDNMPDGNAMNPSDVLISYSGLTIEVIDTDAEGRLVLADGLSYLQRMYHPDVMIDLATLTGSAYVALGAHAGALFCTDDELAAMLFRAGMQSGERVWRMPLWDDYADAMKSTVADIKNYGGRAAGAVTAAKFLQRFTGDHPRWAHLDIAGLVLKAGGEAGDRVATGYGVRLLLAYFQLVIDEQHA